MGLPRFEKCCGFFDLQTGNLILGGINAFTSFCLFVVMIVYAVEFGSLERDTTYDSETLQDVDLIEADAKLSGLYAMSIILVFIFLAKFIFDVIFISGVAMERKGIIKAYFITWVVIMLLSMFTFFLNVENWGPKTISFEVISICLNVYAMLICHSFYVQLNMREEV